MVSLDSDVPAIDVGMEIFQAEAYWWTVLFDVSVLGLNISHGLAGKGDGPAILAWGDA